MDVRFCERTSAKTFLNFDPLCVIALTDKSKKGE